ncbi:MAG: 50S ribosomal protein L10 [Clostridia bacterium]|nr:50S ribosomal protein L10 [Clostridia bacterium]
MPSGKVLAAKQNTVAELTERLQGAVAGVICDYKGITVEADTALRRQLRKAGVEYSVVKNTLLGRAADNCGLGELKECLNGTTALATSTDDLVAAAKILSQYSEKSKGAFVIKAGFVEGNIIDKAGVDALGKLPSREVLIAQVLGGFNAPITSLCRALNAIAEQKTEETPA